MKMASKNKRDILHIAFIGAGVINFGSPDVPWNHSSRLETLHSTLCIIEVLGIVDPDTEKAAKVLETKQNNAMYAGCKVYESTEGLLQDNAKLDVVFIGTPPGSRGSLKPGHDIELQCANRGVDIFLEKPLSNLPPEEFQEYYERLMSTCQRNHVIVSVGYMLRYNATIAKLKEIIQQHGGKVMSLDITFSGSYTHTDEYHRVLNLQTGPGIIVEQQSHQIDIARYIAGEVKEETIHTIEVRDTDPQDVGKLQYIPEGGEDDIEPDKRVPRVTSSHWKFMSGGIGSLLVNIGAPGSKQDLVIDIHLDALRISFSKSASVECMLKVRNIKSLNTEIEYNFEGDDHYLYEMECFIKAVLSREENLIRSSYSDAKKTYELVWAIRRAGETDRLH